MTTPPSPRDRKAALVAATVNGLIILVGAPLLYWGLSSIPFRIDVTVKMLSIVAPFAALAAWRTWTYARHWIAGRASGWGGVLEAGGTAVFVVFAVIGTAPFDRGPAAIPFVAVYAAVAGLLGLIVGLLLRMSALVVLTTFQTPDSTPSA